MTVCPECGHLYDEGELLMEYRHHGWRALRRFPWWQRPHYALHLAAVKEQEIPFCPRCLHDL